MKNVNNFKETNINFFQEREKKILNGKMSNTIKIVETSLGELQMSCPPAFLQEFLPCESTGGGDTGGCGARFVAMFTANIDSAFNTSINVSFNYGENDNSAPTASNMNSTLTGFTLGLSYQETSSSYSVLGDTINFAIKGTLNYNFFVEGGGNCLQPRLYFNW